MNKETKLNFKYIAIFIILFIFLFHSKYVFANASVKDISYELSFYGDKETSSSLPTGLTTNDFTVNTEHGWYEYERDGTKYVVLAAATEELLKSGEIQCEEKDFVHYYHYFDTIQFTFTDKNFDDKVYNGIILDSCGAAMDKRENGNQRLDVYVKNTTNNPSTENFDFNMQTVSATEDGSFSSSAGIKSSKKNQHFIQKLFAEGLRGLADILQIVINDAGNNIKSPESLKLTAPRAEIEVYEELNEQIQVSNYNDEIKTKTFATINLSDKVDEEDNPIYTINTPIPIISIDMYSSCLNKVDFFDLNFLDTSHENKSDAWKVIQKICLAISHSVLYISIALLIVAIIWRAILLIGSSIGDDPLRARESKEIINRVVRATIMITGIYVLISLIINFYNVMLNIVLNGNNSNYLIRVVVQNVYAFNTNVVGYIKFLSMRSGLSGAVGYALLYFIVAFVDTAWFVLMGIRTLGVAFFIIIAPITAVTSMLERTPAEGTYSENMWHFRGWLRDFLILVWLPMLIVIIIRIILIFV